MYKLDSKGAYGRVFNLDWNGGFGESRVVVQKDFPEETVPVSGFEGRVRISR